MCRLRVSELGNGWNDFSGYPETAHALVPGDVVRDEPEERRQCHGVAARVGVGELQDGMDMAAQIAARHGATGRDRLSGTIEVDEAFLGALEEGARGRQTETKALIVVAAQEDGNGIGGIRMRRIPDASADSLMAFVQEAIEPGSVVHTDGWIGYEGVKHFV